MITHYTVGFPVTPEMKYLEHSSRSAGMIFRKLPRGIPDDRIRYLDKYRLLSEALASSALADADIVMFTDAYDVIVLEHGRTIESKFRRLDVDLVFNGEKEFWPHSNPAHVAAYKEMFASFGGVAPYLNSGCYIGFVWAVRKMLAFCLDHSLTSDEHDDQALAQVFFKAMIVSKEMAIVVDNNRMLFGTTSHSRGDYEICAGGVYLKDTTWSLSVIHLNGNRLALDFISFWHRLYGDNHPVHYDLRICKVEDFVVGMDRADRCMVLDREINSRTLVALRKSALFLSFMTLDGCFVTFLPDGSCNADGQVIHRWERVDFRRFQSEHGMQIILRTAPGVQVRDNRLKLEPISLELITQYRLSAFCDRIAQSFDNI